jgi:hypothetical protein
MKKEKLDIVVYNSFAEKKAHASQSNKKLSPRESLICALELMDLMAAMNKRAHVPEDKSIPWTILTIGRKFK